jgi:heptosyltransferase II
LTPDSSPDSSPILVVQTGFLGDAVLATGMLRALHDLVPGVGLGFLVRASVAEMFEGHPAITRLHRLDKSAKGSTAMMAAELREAGYCTALLPHRSLRSSWIARRAGIATRVGFRQSEAPLLLTHRVDYSIARHEVDRNADLIEALRLKVPAASRASWLTARAELVEEMRNRYDQARPIVLLAPGSVWATKRWTPEGFAGVARRLATAGSDPYLIGSPAESELCAAIAVEAGLPSSSNLAGRLNLPELVALVSISARLYTNDSAPLHIAEALGVPVTAIFGPTVPEFGFGPRLAESLAIGRTDLACRPCRVHGSERCPIGTHECMRGIDVGRVLSDQER